MILQITSLICLACTSQLQAAEQNQNITEIIEALPDFSYAGYAFGEKGIPEAEGRVFDVTDFGAIANDENSDQQAIQKAVHAAENNGGGIVFFPPGQFLISDPAIPGQPAISVHNSNIVIKGSGSREGGTEIFVPHNLEAENPQKKWTTPYIFHFSPTESNLSSGSVLETRGMSSTDLKNPAKMGDFHIDVTSPYGFSEGMTIALAAEGTLLNERFTRGLPLRELWARIRESGVAIHEKHLITAVAGNRLYFKAPLTSDMNPQEGWKIIACPMLTNVGFEDIKLRGNFHDSFVHHKDAIHDSGWSAVILQECFNSWVRRCRFVDVSRDARMNGCLASSIILCSTEGNWGHDAFETSFSTRTLIGLVRDEAGMWHGPGASHLALASVIWRSDSPASQGFDFHGTFPRMSLIDACVSGGFSQSGANYKDLPQHLEHAVFWNYQFKERKDRPFHFWRTFPDQPDVEYPKGSDTVMAYATFVGGSMTRESLDPDSPTVLHFPGQTVNPESLYETQMEKRLGYIPVWIRDARTYFELNFQSLN